MAITMLIGMSGMLLWQYSWSCPHLVEGDIGPKYDTQEHQVYLFAFYRIIEAVYLEQHAMNRNKC